MFGSYVWLVHTIHVTDDFVLNVCLESIFTIYGVLKLPLLVYSLVNKGKIRKKIIYIYIQLVKYGHHKIEKLRQ